MTTRDDDPYRDPVLYDLEYHDHTEDIGWYVALARTARGPVLELACGNGRVTLPMARAGARVHGVDISTPMLDALRARLELESPEVRERVTMSVDDFTALQVEGPFDLVLLPFNALHHSRHHDDVRALLAGVAGVLAPGGELALDCYLPDPTLYQRDPSARYGERLFVDPRDRSVLSSWEQSWYDAQAQVHHVTYVYQHPNGEQDRVVLDLRMFYPAELRELIASTGWTITQLHQDFHRTPVGPHAQRYVMRLRPSRR